MPRCAEYGPKWFICKVRQGNYTRQVYKKKNNLEKSFVIEPTRCLHLGGRGNSFTPRFEDSRAGG